MGLITVNPELCIQCGICAKLCPPRVLVMGEQGPEAVLPQNCTACGHCVAICPQRAIDNHRTPLARQSDLKEFPILNAETAQQFLRSRRSIRCYKDIAVSRENLLKLVEIARFAPTASNRQGISYIIIEDQKILKKIPEVTIEWMEAEVEKNTSSHWSFPIHIRAYREKGIDNILHGAPHLILATAPNDFPNGRENTIFSLAYLELYAPALGLGSCWAGLLEMCAASKYEPLLELFNITREVITGAVMVGYPQYSFKRLVDRNPLKVTWL